MATRTKAKTDDITQVDLEIHPNEASDLLPVASKRVLKAHKWDMGFYTVLDEGTIEQCVAVAGHRKGAEPGEGWEVHRLQANAGRGRGKTEDAEACALKDGWVYLIGSHYGSKAGPLEARRAWIARFREDELAGHLGESPATLDIARNRFMPTARSTTRSPRRTSTCCRSATWSASASSSARSSAARRSARAGPGASGRATRR